jgi:hypothetical protein
MSTISRHYGPIIAALVALLAGAALLVLGGEASGRDGGAKSQIKITKLQPAVAKGKVTSGRKSCAGKGRKISLFIYDDFITDKVAITHTKRKGKWRVRRSLKPGKYFAKVDHSKGCRYAVSNNKWLRAN